MSPKNQVLPLSYLSLKFVSVILVHSLSDDEGLHCDEVERYLQDATHEILQDLLKFILNTENLDASTRFSCLQTMLRQDIKRLDTGVFPHSYYSKILQVIEAGTGLQHLNLKGVWLRDFPEELSNVLHKLEKLKVLVIPHMPDDSVLTAAMSCKLTILDISGECNFTLEGLRVLQSPNLKVLSIGMYGNKSICSYDCGDSIEAVAALIQNLPNLNVIKTYSYTGSALLKLFGTNPNFKTKLKYIHDTNTSPEILEAIAKLCPDLESANFNAPLENVTGELNRLRRLNSLKISECFSDELQISLESSNINTLKLNVLRSNLDLSQICTSSPELTTLECYKTSVSFVQQDNYFVSLQNLEILYCDICDSALRYLMRNSPFLRRIVVGDVIRMTDGDIFRLCAECDFLSLEELWFSSARGLTVTSVELLMSHCPNLKVLGQLTGWDISNSDLDYLRAVILSTNTDLTLLPLDV